MTNKFMLLPVILFTVVSCNNETNSNQKNDAELTEKPAEPSNQSRCFEAANNKDTITLHMEINGNEVAGNLSYRIFEKDKNTGIIKGQMTGDTLIAEYTFMSEGIESVREVAFLQKSTNMVEGYGEMEERNGKMVFKNKETLNFDNKITMIKVDCSRK